MDIVDRLQKVVDLLQKDGEAKDAEIARLKEENERMKRERASSFDREFLGQLVRMAWVEWARGLEHPKPSWLVPWKELSGFDKEADGRIGEYIAAHCVNPEPLKMESRTKQTEHENTHPKELLGKTGKALLGLREYRPGFLPQTTNEADGMYELGDEKAPFFSESYLYNLMGKEEARVVLALMRPLFAILRQIEEVGNERANKNRIHR